MPALLREDFKKSKEAVNMSSMANTQHCNRRITPQEVESLLY
jgi:hypothetical protein